MKRLWCQLAWLGGERAAEGVLIELDDGRIAAVTAGQEPAADAEQLPGLTLPGLANAHSHAFQRALRGRTHGGPGSFWTWREQMYELAERLDPDSYFRLARATFGEMALAGMTVVGEFHYLHHAAGGARYDDPNAMGHAVAEAAREAGVRLTLLDACYLHGGVDTELAEPQRRFSDGSAEDWRARVEQLEPGPRLRVGAAIHSVRAVDPGALPVIVGWADDHHAPLHAHVSEQPAENEASLAAYGLTPTALLARAGALSERFTAVHATHLTDEDVTLLGAASAGCCMCPTTERDLADGIGQARRLREAGARLSVGSDSQAVIDAFEEARAIELDERLATGIRGHHTTPDLVRAATANGYASLGWSEGGFLEPGALADLVVVSLDSVRLAGTQPDTALDSVVYAGSAADIRHVMVEGQWIVRDGRHLSVDVAEELRAALAP